MPMMRQTILEQELNAQTPGIPDSTRGQGLIPLKK